MELLHLTAGTGSILAKGEAGIISQLTLNSVSYAQGGKVNNHYFSGGTIYLSALGTGRLYNTKNFTVAM